MTICTVILHYYKAVSWKTREPRTYIKTFFCTPFKYGVLGKISFVSLLQSKIHQLCDGIFTAAGTFFTSNFHFSSRWFKLLKFDN